MKAKFFSILLLVLPFFIFHSCDLKMLTSNVKLSKSDILKNTSFNNFISYSKDDALDIIRDFYRNKGREKDITKDRFYYLEYWNTSSSYGHFEVKFRWKTIENVEVRELRWDDGTGIYKIIVYFPVIEHGEKRTENYDFAKINIDNKNQLVKLVSAIYVLSDLNRFSNKQDILNGPKNDQSALVYGKITIHSNLKFTTVIFLLQKKGDDIKKIIPIRPDENGIFAVANVDGKCSYSVKAVELYYGREDIASIPFGILTINVGGELKRLINLGEIILKIDDETGKVSTSRSIPSTENFNDEISSEVFSNIRFSKWNTIYLKYKNDSN